MNKIITYFREVKIELIKVQWSWNSNKTGFQRYQELADSTLIVVIAMLLLGGYIAFFDFITINVVGFLIHP